MSLFPRLRSLDIYRDIPKEILQEQTTLGAILSITAITLCSILFLTEFAAFLTTTIHHQLTIQQPLPKHLIKPHTTTTAVSIENVDDDEGGHGHGMLHSIDPHFTIPVHLNITFHHLPCACIGVEVEDMFGSLGKQGSNQLYRYATDSEGNIKDFRSPIFQGDHEKGNTLESHIGEGCNVFGNIWIELVPGNFHFLPALSYQHLAIFYPQGYINTSHHIHYLYFGEMTTKEVRKEGLEIIHDPLKDHRRFAMDDASHNEHQQHLANSPILQSQLQHGAITQHHFSLSYEYYLKVVATNYHKLNGDIYYSYQYQVHANELIIPRQLPAIFFRYEFSPITVELRQQGVKFSHFVVQVAAILGGTATVIRLMYATVKTSVNSVTKPQRRKALQQKAALRLSDSIPQNTQKHSIQQQPQPLLSPENQHLLSPSPPASATNQPAFSRASTQPIQQSLPYQQQDVPVVHRHHINPENPYNRNGMGNTTQSRGDHAD